MEKKFAITAKKYFEISLQNKNIWNFMIEAFFLKVFLTQRCT